MVVYRTGYVWRCGGCGVVGVEREQEGESVCGCEVGLRGGEGGGCVGAGGGVRVGCRTEEGKGREVMAVGCV